MVVKPQIDNFDQYIPYPQHLKLLLRATDATTSGMKDFSGYGRVVTNSTGATGSTTQKKLNPYSMYFDGTDDVISIPDSPDWNMGSENFTYAMWVSVSIESGTRFIVSQETSDTNRSIAITISSPGYVGCNIYNSTSLKSIAVSNVFTTNQFFHLVFQRDGNTIFLYINGNLVGSTDVTGFTSMDTAGSYYVGGQGGLTRYYFGGYIDELAYWKGIAVPINQLYPQRKPFSFRRA